MKAPKRKYVGKTWLALVAAPFVITACTTEMRRPLAQRDVDEAGFYLNHDETVARGGVGNYIERSEQARKDVEQKLASRSASADQQLASNRPSQKHQWDRADVTDQVGTTSSETDQEAGVSGASASKSEARMEEGPSDQRVHFVFGKAELSDPSEMSRVIGYLKQNPGAKLRIEGNADAIGSAEFNRELSMERAQLVKDQLVQAGLDADKIQVKAFGESKPVASNQSEEGRAQNRRADIVALTG